jgi:hypothetical protein
MTEGGRAEPLLGPALEPANDTPIAARGARRKNLSRIEHLFYNVPMVRQQNPDRMLAAALYGHARRLALNEGSIADARQFLEGRAAGRN